MKSAGICGFCSRALSMLSSSGTSAYTAVTVGIVIGKMGYSAHQSIAFDTATVFGSTIASRTRPEISGWRLAKEKNGAVLSDSATKAIGCPGNFLVQKA